jgi:Cu-Zn family superoxide dismutase
MTGYLIKEVYRMRKLTKFLPAILACGLLVASAAGQTHKVDLRNSQGADVGKATITKAKNGPGVTIKLDLKNLPPGTHGIHFHQVAKCEAPGFTTAGGHFNPTLRMHGLHNPAGPHAGDMMNFEVDKNGKAKVTLTDERVDLGSGANSLYSGGGTALVIHEKADDYTTDPSGNSGARIACGVIIK